MVLSICMMVKNEESNIRRCLDSLDKIRGLVSNELIIIDTGSIDNTINIAKEYTDLVYIHEWDNNFSSMRNTSMSYAKGKWILIIDADEELLDHNDLVKFLLSKHNKEITGASLHLRNIKSVQKNSFSSELTTVRIVRNGIGAHYEGVVHNRLVLSGKVIQLNSILHHYGYILDDKELMDKKFERTKNLLIEELSKSPNEPYLLYQLATSYGMHSDWNEAFHYSKIAYELVRNSELDLSKYPYVISSYCSNCYATGRYYESIQAAKYGISLEPDFIDLYYYKASSHGKLSEKAEAIQEYCNYLDCLNRFDKTGFKYNPSIQHYSLNFREEAYCNLTLLFASINNNEKALFYSNKLLDIAKTDSLYIIGILDAYISIIIEEKKYEKMLELLSRFKHDILQIVEKVENRFDKLLEVDKVKFYEILLNSDSYYGTINKLRVLSDDEDFILTQREVDNLKICIKVGIPDALYFCLKYNIEIEALLIDIDEKNIMNQIAISNERFVDFESLVSERCIKISEINNFRYVYAKRIYFKYLLIKNISSSNIVYFDNFIKIVHKQMVMKYNIDFISIGLYEQFYSREEQFGAIVYNLMNELDGSLLNKAISIYPEMKRQLLNWLNLKIDSNVEDSEMSNLILELKNQITILCENKQFVEALELINEALKIVPKDLDLIELKSDILLLQYH